VVVNWFQLVFGGDRVCHRCCSWIGGAVVTGLEEGTVLMVSVIVGVMTGVGDVGFLWKIVVGKLSLSCRVLLTWTLLCRDKIFN